jgi:hypothetical protein
MGKPLALLKVSALLAIAPLGACATPTDTDSQFSALPEFREPAVAVFDDGKQALFKAERSYTLSLAGNEEGRVYQALDGMVRITPDGRPGYWLRCADLQAGLAQCSGAAPDAAIMRRSLPACPGDPRCPRRDAGKK